MARKLPSLPRRLGAPALFAAAYGEIGSSLYFALAVTAAYALSLTPLVFLAAGLVFALAAAAYAEGATAVEGESGSPALARRAFNDLAAFVAGWATVLDYVLVIALSALFVPHYAAGAFGDPEALSHWEATAAGVAVIAGVVGVRLVRRPNIYGLGVLLAVLDLAVQALLAGLGLALLWNWDRLTVDIVLGEQPTWSAVAFALPIAMVGFTGLEKSSSLVRQARDPARTVPRAVGTSVITVVVLYAAIATAAASAYVFRPDPDAPSGFSSGLTTTWFNAPLLGVTDAIGAETTALVGDVLRVVVGLTACAILLLAIITGFSGCSRLGEAMGKRLALPAVFGRTSRRTLASPASLVAAAALSAGFLVVGALFEGEEALTLAALYSFGILIAFMLAQAAVIWLRIQEPDLPRPFLVRGNVRVRGRLIPVACVVGLAASFAAWVIALGTHEGSRVVGPLWILAGLGVYAAVRLREGVPLTGRVDLGAPPPEHVTEVAYGNVVVPLERLDVIGEEMAATACRLAAESGAGVVGMTCIAVPVRHALDRPMPEREREAEAVQGMARALAADYGVGYTGIVRRTRNPGRTIIDAAAETGAELIVVGAPEKRRAAHTAQAEFFGATVDFILRRAPCRVIVTHFPAAVEQAETGAAGATAAPASAPARSG
jgi:APA family basic amino acid/polyamine antiporter